MECLDLVRSGIGLLGDGHGLRNGVHDVSLAAGRREHVAKELVLDSPRKAVNGRYRNCSFHDLPQGPKNGSLITGTRELNDLRLIARELKEGLEGLGVPPCERARWH